MTVFLERTDLVQLALVEALSQICPTQWAYGEPSEDLLPGSVYTLTWMGSSGDQVHNRPQTVYTLDSYTITVNASEAGRELAAEINGVRYLVTATDADPATLRGLLLAAILADTGASYTPAPSGASSIVVTPNESGSLLSASIPLGGDLVTTLADHEIDPHLVTTSVTTVRVQIQGWAASTAPRLSAHLLLAHGQSLLQGPTATEALRQRGCVIRSWDAIADLTAISGARWASRAAVELELAYQTRLVTEATRIQTTTNLLEISP